MSILAFNKIKGSNFFHDQQAIMPAQDIGLLSNKHATL